MADESYRKTYYTADFTSLSGSLAESKGLLDAALSALTLTVPVNEVRLALGGAAAIVEWQSLPDPADVAAVDAAVAAFEGGETTSELLFVESLGITAATVQDELVTVIDATTPPRDAGTYLATWNAQIAMLATVNNAGVRALITWTLIRGAQTFVRAYETHWTLQQPSHFGSAFEFDCIAGDQIRAVLQVAKIGVPAATARMATARVSVDLIRRP